MSRQDSKINEEVANELRRDFMNTEYAHAYMADFLNASIATQIRVLRDDQKLTQGQLADKSDMKQARISLMENVDYGSWSITTLRRLAQAFDVVLKVSFETFGDAIKDVASFSRESLQREPREADLKAIADRQALNDWLTVIESASLEEPKAVRMSVLEVFKQSERDTSGNSAAQNVSALETQSAVNASDDPVHFSTASAWTVPAPQKQSVMRAMG